MPGRPLSKSKGMRLSVEVFWLKIEADKAKRRPRLLIRCSVVKSVV